MWEKAGAGGTYQMSVTGLVILRQLATAAGALVGRGKLETQNDHQPYVPSSVHTFRTRQTLPLAVAMATE